MCENLCVRCRECFDEVDPKSFVCPRCGAATDYFRGQSKARLWARLLTILALFVVAGFLLWKLLSEHQPEPSTSDALNLTSIGGPSSRL